MESHAGSSKLSLGFMRWIFRCAREPQALFIFSTSQTLFDLTWLRVPKVTEILNHTKCNGTISRGLHDVKSLFESVSKTVNETLHIILPRKSVVLSTPTLTYWTEGQADRQGQTVSICAHAKCQCASMQAMSRCRNLGLPLMYGLCAQSQILCRKLCIRIYPTLLAALQPIRASCWTRF